jgi:uncharacterized membrane protein YtjA (UPF0391 family)
MPLLPQPVNSWLINWKLERSNTAKRRKAAITALFSAVLANGMRNAITVPTFANQKIQSEFFLRSITVLYWALMFLVVALVAAALGFSGIAGAATGIAKILFFVFLVFFIVSLAAGARRPRAI